MINKYSLFLDDERYPHDVTWVDLPLVEWTIVRNYKQFVDTITINGMPQNISFDHDLADVHYKKSIALNKSGGTYEYSDIEEKTGYDCAKWLVDYCMEKNIEIPPYTVHSMSIIGKQNIIQYLENYKSWKHKQK